MNAREEMLEFIQSTKKEIKCAEILLDDLYREKEYNHIVLKVGHTEEEYSKFLNDLDFEYTNGAHELSGTIWFKDGAWAKRDESEYDGPEWWEVHYFPDIPRHLL